MHRVNYGKIVNLSSKMDANTRDYTVDSLLSANLKYIIKDDEFIVAYDDGEMHHDLKDIPTEAYDYIPEVRAEILAIYEDVKDLKRMGIAI
ncbi:hypothetical protein LI171_04895 [Emergencia timonensis]|uniref:hypothetical protein n=1 Tax=Emergencia timonensis TaxID=1776384 RepID=UPI001D094555|nr:hypothetical protein [Emergencia timonensis]MCB6475575.1 hypothetical protein [Emergencia timonensis]